MVNYKRVICEVAVLAVGLAVVSGAPTYNASEEYHDLRQTGDRNIRGTVDGLFIAEVPSDAFLEAILAFTDSTDTTDLEAILPLLKPPPSGSSTGKPETSDSKPDSEKPAALPLSDVSLQSEIKAQKKETSTGRLEKIQRITQRLANVMIPLLRKHVNAAA